MSELKPCPFCQCAPIINGDLATFEHKATCWFYHKHQARYLRRDWGDWDAWNRRADDALRAERDALREALEGWIAALDQPHDNHDGDEIRDRLWRIADAETKARAVLAQGHEGKGLTMKHEAERAAGVPCNAAKCCLRVDDPALNAKGCAAWSTMIGNCPDYTPAQPEPASMGDYMALSDAEKARLHMVGTMRPTGPVIADVRANPAQPAPAEPIVWHGPAPVRPATPEIDALLASLDAGGGWCPECGACGGDEEGLCLHCGATCIGTALRRLKVELSQITRMHPVPVLAAELRALKKEA